MPLPDFRIRSDTKSARAFWGKPTPVPEGSDFNLIAELTVNNVNDTLLFDTTYALSLRDVSDSSASLILTDEASDASDTSLTPFQVKWTILDTQSSGWASDSDVTFHGDIKGTDTTGLVSYWPVGLVVRGVLD